MRRVSQASLRRRRALAGRCQLVTRRTLRATGRDLLATGCALLSCIRPYFAGNWQICGQQTVNCWQLADLLANGCALLSCNWSYYAGNFSNIAGNWPYYAGNWSCTGNVLTG